MKTANEKGKEAMSNFKHSSKCLKLRSKELSKREAFLKSFPKACNACSANGFVTFSESRGEFWGAPCSEQMTKVCESCLALGKCPRCGVESEALSNYNFTDEQLLCPSCGWTIKSEPLLEVVSDDDCGCLEDYLEQVTNALR